MIRIIIAKGIPASGKTSFAKDLIKKNIDFKRVNKDDLRSMLDSSSFSQENENFVENTRNFIIKESLFKGKSIIVDDTNLNSKHEKKIRSIAQRFVNATNKIVSFEIKWFHIDKKTAIERDKARTAQVGEKVIIDMMKKYDSIKDKTDKIELLYPIYGNNEQNLLLEKAIISDIDGTVAKSVNRSSYDYDKVDQDEPNMPIINLLNILNSNGKKIVFFSGRDEICREKTVNWLKRYFDFEIELYMRRNNDFRKDNIIKAELYSNYIKNKYFIEFVVDDRDQVVDLWRNELQLTCLQVDYGCF